VKHFIPSTVPTTENYSATGDEVLSVSKQIKEDWKKWPAVFLHSWRPKIHCMDWSLRSKKGLQLNVLMWRRLLWFKLKWSTPSSVSHHMKGQCHSQGAQTHRAVTCHAPEGFSGWPAQYRAHPPSSAFTLQRKMGFGVSFFFLNENALQKFDEHPSPRQGQPNSIFSLW